MRNLTVSQSQAGQRADIFVAGSYPQFSRSALDVLFDECRVTLGGKPVKSSYNIKIDDILSVDDELLLADPPKIEMAVLYEDDDVLVLDKPAGTLTHAKGAINNESSVASFIRPHVDKEITGNRAGIVHRLDRATSGVIITAKNQAALSWLQKQFSTRKTKKTYMAVLDGVPNLETALVDAPIARNPKQPQTFYVNKDGKAAQTEYKILKIITKGNHSYAVAELKPKTGRTHQLRIHMAYIGHPIVGDRVYGKAGDYLLLHAQQLELTLPNRERLTFDAPLSDHIKEFIG